MKLDTSKKENRKGFVFPAFVAVVMLAVACLFLMRSCSAPKQTNVLEAALRAELGQLEGKPQSEIQAELNRVIADGMFHISINTNPVFSTGNADGSLQIENVPNNRYGMVVELYRKDTGEKIYHSGLIAPNYHIQRDVLSAELAAGKYEATAVFQAYTLDTAELVGTAGCEIVISVLY